MQWLFDWLTEALLWLVDLLLWLPLKIWELLCDGFASFVEWIPVPDFMDNASIALGSIPPGVAYYAALIQIPEGLLMCTAALTLRFIIRRIPLIG